MVWNEKLWTEQEGNRMLNPGQKQGGILFSRQFINNFRKIFQIYTSYPLGMLVKATKKFSIFFRGPSELLRLTRTLLKKIKILVVFSPILY